MSEPRFLTLKSPAAPSTQAETEANFAAVAEVLEAEGRTWDDLVWFRIFYRERADFPRLNEVRKPYFEGELPGGDFPATTGVVTGLNGDGATVEFEMMLGAGKALRDTPRVWKVIRGGLGRPPAAHGVEWGGLLWISGQVGYDEEANLVADSALGQLPQALRNLWAIVEDAGHRKKDVVQFTFHLVASAFGEYEEVREEFELMLAAIYGTRPPLVSFVGVEELFMPGVVVEIEAYVASDPATRVVPIAEPVEPAAADPVPAATATEPSVEPAPVAIATPALAELGTPVRSAPAGRVGEFAFGVGASVGDSVADCFDAAIDDLAARLATVEADPSELSRATLWYSPRESHAEVASLLDAAIGTRLPASLAGKVLLTPISTAAEVPASIRLEAMAVSAD
jgi:enamine deaminase RidA (YjgF/YER057c/UK114 family)